MSLARRNDVEANASRAALGAAIDDLSPELRRRFLRLIDMWRTILERGHEGFVEIMRTIVRRLGA